MKKYLLLLLAFACLLMLSGCGCEHQWMNIAGGHGQICVSCDETQNTDEPCTWEEASCLVAKKCTVCGATDGEALGHLFDESAPDCENPKHCGRCGAAEGEAKPHNWVEATTEAPKTCLDCGMTEGERIITDPRFTTAACQALFGSWEGGYTMTGEMMGNAEIPDMPVILGITFHNDGTYSETARMADKEGYTKLLKAYYIQALYAEFETMHGMTKEQADQVMLQAYGMNTEDYAGVMATAIDWDTLLAASCQEGVYYVENRTLYSGPDWNTLEGEALKLGENTLTLSIEDIGEVLLTRVK